MIRNRSRASAAPQESLSQFSIVSKKGVDVTKAPVDLTHVDHMCNLVVNPDGSVSPRKPIVEVSKYSNAKFVSRLHDFDTVVTLSASGDYDVLTVGNSSYVFRMYDEMYRKFDSALQSAMPCTFLQYVPEDVQLTKTKSTSILSNVRVCVGNLVEQLGFENFALPSNASEFVPRYLVIYKEDSDWVVELKTPEVGLLYASEGSDSFVLNPNLTLDNPYAVRDGYSSGAPAVKGVWSYLRTSGTSAAPTDETEIVEAFTNEVETVTGTHVKTVRGILDQAVLLKNSKGVATRYGTVNVVFELSITNLAIGGGRGEESGHPDNEGYVTEGTIRRSACSIRPKVYVEVSSGSSATLEVDLECEVGFTIHAGSRAESSELHTAAVSALSADVGESYTELIASYEDDYLDYADTSDSSSWIFTRTASVGPDERLLWESVSVSAVLRIVHAEVRETITEYALKVDGGYDTTIKDLTESVTTPGFRMVSSHSDEAAVKVLKALCTFPHISKDTNLYGAWEFSRNGVDWVSISPTGRETVRAIDRSEGVEHVIRFARIDVANSCYDRIYSGDGSSVVQNRVDVCVVGPSLANRQGIYYRFTLAKLREIDDSYDLYDQSVAERQYIIDVMYGRQATLPEYGPNLEVAYVDVGNASLGKKLYYKNSIVSYADPSFANNVIVSEPGSFITPLSSIIDTVVSSVSGVTKVTPWKDYLLTFTENTTLLCTPVEGGFTSKIVSANVGIPEAFGDCCAATLNGFVFATSDKVYMAYPNLYSGSENSLSLTEISAPVEHVFSEYTPTEYKPFALATSSEYILMLPRTLDTLCLRYDFTDKLWTVLEYPVTFVKCDTTYYEDVRMFAKTSVGFSEYLLDSEPVGMVYGDILNSSTPNSVTPIAFEWDTGQKTDHLSFLKQFVESKLVFTVEDEFEAFPMDLTVAVDGAPHVTHVDISTDAPFWKDSFRDKAVAGTGSILNIAGSAKGVIRQLTVRYSGKGRSVRHILSGDTLSPFRLYEAYIRYKPLNVKQ